MRRLIILVPLALIALGAVGGAGGATFSAQTPPAGNDAQGAPAADEVPAPWVAVEIDDYVYWLDPTVPTQAYVTGISPDGERLEWVQFELVEGAFRWAQKEPAERVGLWTYLKPGDRLVLAPAVP